MKKFTILFFLVVSCILCSCNSYFFGNEGYAEVSFKRDKKGLTKSLSTSDGEEEVLFSEVDHVIKLENSDGTGYCSIKNATKDYVAWPESSVELGYGTWTVYAKGVKGDKTYYQNSDGVEFIVGPKGVSVDGGESWSSCVSIQESYCFQDSAKIQVNSYLTVKDESGDTVTLGTGSYADYEIRWYRTTLATPTNLLSARTVSELTAEGTEFTEWETPTDAIEVGCNTYVLAAIVDRRNPSTLYGTTILKLEHLTDGQLYVIGSGSGDYIQFGFFVVDFDKPYEHVYSIGDTGPAGGFIFYDCDADNDLTNNGAGPDGLLSSECGWRYLEAAPSDLYLSTASFGSFLADEKWHLDVFTNGTATYDDNCTQTAIGTGAHNTFMIVNLIEKLTAGKGFLLPETDVGRPYFAKMCADYELNDYDDWFLPSKDEMNLLYENLFVQGKGNGNADFWYASSSESSVYNYWIVNLNEDFSSVLGPQEAPRNMGALVRPVRTFTEHPSDSKNHEFRVIHKEESTCSQAGIDAYKCSCGYSYTVKLPKLEHTYNDQGICTICGKRAIGSVGPAGGYIFYDCDEDNSDLYHDRLRSDTCGWRYLEVSPENVSVGDTKTFIYGYNYNSLGIPVYSNGFESATNGSTGSYYGDGLHNTKRIVKAMGAEAYASNTEKTAYYAAKLCDDYVYGGFYDWYLPSYYELSAISEALAEKYHDLFDVGYYWSSTEKTDSDAYICKILPETEYDNSSGYARELHYVRAVRAFSDTEVSKTHEFTDTITKQPTCTEDGTKKVTCSCGYTYEVHLEHLNHSYDEGLRCTRCSFEVKKGPAGGYVFYDCDADNDATNNGAGPDGLKSTVCGWRFLEAAPEDLGTKPYGYFNDVMHYINGTSKYDDSCTKQAIGTGLSNTELLVSTMQENAYVDSNGKTKSGDYAAKICSDFSYGSFSDWFLPSIDELQLMCHALACIEECNFDSRGYYASSSESLSHSAQYYIMRVEDASVASTPKYREEKVRPIRAFK